jgi:hypothetical protein
LLEVLCHRRHHFYYGPLAPSPSEPPKLLSYSTVKNSFIMAPRGDSQKSYTISILPPVLLCAPLRHPNSYYN